VNDDVVQVSRETDSHEVSRETNDASGADIGVSRETSPESAWQLPPELANSPFAVEAAQAVSMQNSKSDVWPSPAEGPRLIAVANQKGGVGKTTSTVNLAAALAMHGLRVLVVDLDPQGNASTALGVPHPVGTPSTYDVVLGASSLADVTVPVPAVDGLFCAPATIDLAGAEVELADVEEREYCLRRALEPLVSGNVGRRYDYVFIDCPPSLGQLTVNGLVAARELLLPIQCEFYALEGLAQLLSTVELVHAHLNPALAVSAVLLTMYDSRTRLADQVAAEVRRHFGDLVLPGSIPRGVRVSEAPGFGQTVMTYDPGSRGALAYLNAAKHLAHSQPASPATTEPASPPGSDSALSTDKTIKSENVDTNDSAEENR
jgi:chromosome partitioning protein